MTFCRVLAGMIRPNGKNCTLYVMRLARKKKGQPAKPNIELGNAMIDATSGAGRGHLKGIKQDVAKKFGVTVRTAESAMRAEKEWRELSELLDVRAKINR